MMSENINLVEVFSSIQGEGLYVGCRQVFVRLAGCNIECAYCDTAASRKITSHCRIESISGQRDFVNLCNPLVVDDLAKRINSLLLHPHHSVSLTGGEPLCQAAALNELAPQIKGLVYLETNGTMPDELAKVVANIDIISMDIKLPSITGRYFWNEHAKFLQIAKQRKVFVKLVLSGETSHEELDRALALIADVDNEIPLILQPVTPINGCSPVSSDALLAWQSLALTVLKDVRVIPQTHKYLGQL